MTKQVALKLSFILVIGLTVSCLVLLHLFSLADYKLNEVRSALTSPAFVTLLVTSAVSLTTGILAAAVYGTIEDRQYKFELDSYKQLAPGGLFEDIVSSLKVSRGRFMSDYNLTMTLKMPKSNKTYFNLCCEYDYRKRLHNRTLVFRYFIARNSQEMDSYNQELPSASDYTTHEFVQLLPEVSLRNHVGDDKLIDDEHFLRDLFVESTELKLSRSLHAPFTWTAEIPSHVDLSIPVRIQYYAQFPVLTDDFTYQLLEFPTRNTVFKFIYTDVKDLINVDSFEFFTSEVGPALHGDDSTGVHRLAYPKWALAKSGAAFVWTQRAR